MNLTATLFALFGPFLLWPIEIILPFPYLVEELFKLFIVLFILKDKSDENPVATIVVSGILFSLSETVLYIFKINAYGDIGILFARLIYTTVLHTTTFLVIYYASKKKPFLYLGLLAAILIHYLYNVYI